MVRVVTPFLVAGAWFVFAALMFAVSILLRVAGLTFLVLAVYGVLTLMGVVPPIDIPLIP